MPDGRLRRAADYQETPCLMDGAKEGAFMTLTALPFKDYMNFAVGAVIQECTPTQGSKHPTGRHARASCFL